VDQRGAGQTSRAAGLEGRGIY